MTSGLLDSTRIDCIKNGLTNEISYFTNTQSKNYFTISDEDVKKRIDCIKSIVNNLQLIQKKPTVADLFTEIDKHIYKKPWNRLQSFHKIIKIKEYIDTKFGNGTLQNAIILELNKHINDGKLNTKKSVDYDKDLEKIISIPILTIDLKNNKYSIKLT